VQLSELKSTALEVVAACRRGREEGTEPVRILEMDKDDAVQSAHALNDLSVGRGKLGIRVSGSIDNADCFVEHGARCQVVNGERGLTVRPTSARELADRRTPIEGKGRRTHRGRAARQY
jgi:hypothetical protein